MSLPCRSRRCLTALLGVWLLAAPAVAQETVAQPDAASAAVITQTGDGAAAGGSGDAQAGADGADAQAAAADDAEDVREGQVPDEVYAGVSKILFSLLVIAVVLESALAVIFNWRWFLGLFDGRGMKTLVSIAAGGSSLRASISTRSGGSTR